MLCMTTGQISYPILKFIEMKANDFLFHLFCDELAVYMKKGEYYRKTRFDTRGNMMGCYAYTSCI